MLFWKVDTSIIEAYIASSNLLFWPFSFVRSQYYKSDFIDQSSIAPLSTPFLPILHYVLREFNSFLSISLKHHCPIPHILVLKVLSVPRHFMFIRLAFLLFFILFLVSFLFLMPVCVKNFDVHFDSVWSMSCLSPLLQLFVLFEECGVSVHFCQLIHHFIPHVLCNT